MSCLCHIFGRSTPFIALRLQDVLSACTGRVPGARVSMVVCDVVARFGGVIWTYPERCHRGTVGTRLVCLTRVAVSAHE